MKVEQAQDIEFLEKFAGDFEQFFDLAVQEYANLNTDNALDRFVPFLKERLEAVKKYDPDTIR